MLWLPCGACISRCCLCADIITSCTSCYSRFGFTTKSYTASADTSSVMTNSYCIIYSCSSFCIARANNNRIISTCYLSVITNNNCIISIGYSVLEPIAVKCCTLDAVLPTPITRLSAFSTISTCYSIVNTNH